MKDFKIFRVHDVLIMVHIIEKGKSDKIYAFDSDDEACRFVLNHNGLVNQWDLILAQIDL